MAVKLGEYILARRIGKGGMGQVFLAKQESLDREVAVKVLPKELAKDETFRARFEREAKSAASLIHPNVIQVYSFGIEKGVPYFAMEYVDGKDLSAKLKVGEKFDTKESVRIVRAVGKALECAHRHGMVHRDIKPSNVMFASDGAIKVMDFGLAKAARVRTSITQKGLIMGTPPYMSPEQGKGEELDVRSDMYSLGIVFYELLTGTVPFKADSPTALIYQHIYEKPTPPREINPEVPEILEAIALRLLEKNPDDRYLDPSALLADLDAYETGSTIPATMQLPSGSASFPKTLEIDTSITATTEPAAPEGVSKTLLAGIAGGIIAAAVLLMLLLTVWKSDSPASTINVVHHNAGAGAPEVPPDRQPAPGPAPPPEPVAEEEGLLTLSALRAAVPDDVQSVLLRALGEHRRSARILPFEDNMFPVGTYILSFERRGYRTEELTVELTTTGSSPRLDEVKITFRLAPELQSAYLRGKELVNQKKYAEALPDLRRVHVEIPHYEDIGELIALCEEHVKHSQNMKEIYRLGMKYYRDGQWEKVVETLSRLPEDFEDSSKAFGVLADAREKLRDAKRLRKLILEAQEALLVGNLAQAESSARAAVALDGANETANSVLTRVVTARQLMSAASQAEARLDYEAAAKKLKDLLSLIPRCDREKEHLAEIEARINKLSLRCQKISALIDEADFALKAGNPESAISKLKTVLSKLDPANDKARLLLKNALEALTQKIITEKIASFDKYFGAGKTGKLVEMIDPERTQLRSDVARQMAEFFRENVRVISAEHKDLIIRLDRDTAAVDTVFCYEIELTEASRKVSGSLKRKITLVRRADKWYIAAIENLD